MASRFLTFGAVGLAATLWFSAMGQGTQSQGANKHSGSGPPAPDGTTPGRFQLFSATIDMPQGKVGGLYRIDSVRDGIGLADERRAGERVEYAVWEDVMEFGDYISMARAEQEEKRLEKQDRKAGPAK